MKYLLCVWFALLVSTKTFSQRFFAEKSSITFFSDGVVEDIRGNNNTVTSIFDLEKKEIAFLVRVRDFEFEKKLMQIHFNEKYLESEKFPKSTFVGQVLGFNSRKEGIQHVTASGKLFIHGVTRDVKIPGTIEKNGTNLTLRSKFMLKLADYNINVPQVIWKNVAEDVEVDLNLTYVPL